MDQIDYKIDCNRIRGLFCLCMIVVILSGCAASRGGLAGSPKTQQERARQSGPASHKKMARSQASSRPATPPILWQPSFKVGDVQIEKNKLGLPRLKVGADIESQNGKVPLQKIIKALARLKGFTVSWNQDVNQDAPVDVDIHASDDFWSALDNILRQLDYFFKFKDNTLIIGYKETKTYQIAMPNISYRLTAAVGGNMLGGDTDTKNLGEVSLSTVKRTNEDWSREKNRRYVNRYDLWKEFRQNLDQILEIWKMENAQRRTLTSVTQASREYQERGSAKTKETKRPAVESSGWVGIGGGSYTIDESLGIVTVNASPSLQRRVARYINIFKSSLYRQVSIQIHILEVQLSKGSSKGIDWSKVLKDAARDSSLISGQIGYGKNGIVYQAKSPEATAIRKGLHLIGKISLAPTSFKLLINALEEQGTVHTLSEPRITLLNGSPGLLTVGESVRYIREVTKDVSQGTGTTGSTITYTAQTDDILSGLAFSVVCNILGNNDLVLYLTPVTSELKRPIEYRTFGPNKELEVGLPDVKLRQMSTMAKVRNNEFLILGGLIDETSSNNSSNVPLLGRIPLLKWVFSNEIRSKNRRELVIILQPHILPNSI